MNKLIKIRRRNKSETKVNEYYITILDKKRKNYYPLLIDLLKIVGVCCENYSEEDRLKWGNFVRRATIVHHINRNRKDNRLNNLMLVCNICHKKIHYPHKDYEKIIHRSR